MAASMVDLNPEQAVEAGGDGEDSRLVEALRAGSGEAYERLLARFERPVYNLALRLLNSEGDAADVVQEVFLKVFRNVGNFRGQSSLKTWIYRITVNEAQNARRWFFRHRRREIEMDPGPDGSRALAETIPDRARSAFEMVMDRERQALVENALSRINPVFREAVVLRDITDLSYEEVAEALGVSLGTVKSRIMRGREALRDELASRLEPLPALGLVPKTAE